MSAVLALLLSACGGAAMSVEDTSAAPATAQPADEAETDSESTPELVRAVVALGYGLHDATESARRIPVGADGDSERIELASRASALTTPVLALLRDAGGQEDAATLEDELRELRAEQERLEGGVTQTDIWGRLDGLAGSAIYLADALGRAGQDPAARCEAGRLSAYVDWNETGVRVLEARARAALPAGIEEDLAILAQAREAFDAERARIAEIGLEAFRDEPPREDVYGGFIETMVMEFRTVTTNENDLRPYFLADVPPHPYEHALRELERIGTELRAALEASAEREPVIRAELERGRALLEALRNGDDLPDWRLARPATGESRALEDVGAALDQMCGVER